MTQVCKSENEMSASENRFNVQLSLAVEKCLLKKEAMFETASEENCSCISKKEEIIQVHLRKTICIWKKSCQCCEPWLTYGIVGRSLKSNRICHLFEVFVRMWLVQKNFYKEWRFILWTYLILNYGYVVCNCHERKKTLRSGERKV